VNRRILTALFLVLWNPFLAWTQTKADFSGTWKLNLEKSDYGDLQGPSSRIDVIDQKGELISERVVAKVRNKIQNYTLTFSTDGRTTVLPQDSYVRMGFVTLHNISAYWQDSSLVVMQGMYFEDYDIVAKNLYSLSADGNTLIIAVSLNGGDSAAKFVFDRVLPQQKIE